MVQFTLFVSLLARAACITVVALSVTAVSMAQVMNSASYQIQSDSINFGGGYATSSSYVLESTSGEVATGPSDSDTYRLRAGYQQMQEVYLAMTEAADVVMAPSIGGLTGGESNGSTSVNVVSDSSSGYQLTIETEGEPAMQKGSDTIADYVPAGGNPDVTFITDGTDAHFGFSPFGDDVVTRYLENAGSCNQSSGSASTTACWDGLSTSSILIAEDTNANQPSGATTTIYFKVGVGGAAGQPPGFYYATSTLTALSL